MRSLDREEREIYMIQVAAIDDNNPSLVSTATVTIQVVDLNDNTPVFVHPGQDNFTIGLSNRASRGHTVAVIKAVDSDAGKNAQVGYSIEGGNASKSMFNIDSTTGVLSLNVGLRGDQDNQVQTPIYISGGSVGVIYIRSQRRSPSACLFFFSFCDILLT